MQFVVRLDLERIRVNLERALEQPQTGEDVHRLLAAFGVWRKNEEWFGASEAALTNFVDGEVLEKRPSE
jgi:hypothetical protein